MTFFEVTTSWNIPSGIPTKSYMYFLTDEAPSAIRAALGTFWETVEGTLSSAVYWSVDPEGRELNPASGQLEAVWTSAGAVAGQGTGSANPVADATQINLQWNTSSVLAGRFLRGRTYIPGCAAAALSGGNLAEANRAAITGAGIALSNAGVGMSVWHRPKNGALGNAVVTNGAICRSELAVLRKRRNRSS